MVATLVHYDFIERDHESGLYAITTKALHTVQKGLNSDPIIVRVDLMLREIVSRTQDSALFMVKCGNRALVTKRYEGTTATRVQGSQVGMELPLHCGGAPMALLAFSPDSEVDDYLSTPLEQRTEATCTDTNKLRAYIARDRMRGYSVGKEDLFEYVVAVGAPVMSSQGKLVGAISVGNIVQRYPVERINEVGQILVDITTRF
jgi:DNA-binding IclR family transcriptional regulator